ncbi:HlyD family type I secretion periplasmic adaptor subunit [Salinarimonas soli]|uniref:Membrane fusion protein (MFP) family protein n=2 Tax=Salinarimonas soli TaxID=1638099 RepID=A0A5B2VVE7_9HYPH|nr:HlyD family type I secretion periplasmic adaptor subunit [Salinarimonas soli]
MRDRPEIGRAARWAGRHGVAALGALPGDLRTLCAPSRAEDGYEAGLRWLWLRGLALLAVFVATVGLWLLTANLSSAVVAPGQFVVEGYGKKIQHPSGGVVRDIYVREGQKVQEGDVLLRLDETITRANLQVLVKQLDELVVRRARLVAERDGSRDMVVPTELDDRLAEPAVDQLLRAERHFFQMRLTIREGQRAQLSKRIVQAQDEVRGLRSQEDAKNRELDIVGRELEGVRDLYRKSLIQVARLNALEREAASLEGQRGQLVASIAQTEGKIAELELQILQIDQDVRTEAQKELGEIRGRVAELTERRIAADDQLRRIEIRAPVSGFVHQLATHTVGGVVNAAEPLMLIVPTSDQLVLEGKVLPKDRDLLHMGQPANVRVTAFNQRTTPELKGELSHISPDVVRDSQTSESYYRVRVSIPAAELKRLAGAEVVAGMQAEMFIQVASRTPMQYLTKPLTDQIARAFKER